jgi:hypothetical protein
VIAKGLNLVLVFDGGRSPAKCPTDKHWQHRRMAALASMLYDDSKLDHLAAAAALQLCWCNCRVFEGVVSHGSSLRGSSLRGRLSTRVHGQERDYLGSVDNRQRFHTSWSADDVFQSVLENWAVLFSKLQQNHVVSVVAPNA